MGEMIPFDTTGIDFALTALFVVIFVDMIRGTKSKTSGAGSSFVISFVDIACRNRAVSAAFLAHNGSSFDIF